jgi:septal ring factor EnvC (AmiA/AmiB activator)
MRIINPIFRAILVFMMFSFISTSILAQENTEELKAGMREIENRIHEIENEQRDLSNQLREDLNEDQRRELEAMLGDRDIEHETLHKELHDLREKLRDRNGPTPPIVEIIKQPPVLAAIIGAIAIIVAALIRRSRKT